MRHRRSLSALMVLAFCVVSSCDEDEDNNSGCVSEGCRVCGFVVVDTLANEANCGECGNVCAHGEQCVVGVCTAVDAGTDSAGH